MQPTHSNIGLCASMRQAVPQIGQPMVETPAPRVKRYGLLQRLSVYISSSRIEMQKATTTILQNV
jgi:hypothetical protein